MKLRIFTKIRQDKSIDNIVVCLRGEKISLASVKVGIKSSSPDRRELELGTPVKKAVRNILKKLSFLYLKLAVHDFPVSSPGPLLILFIFCDNGLETLGCVKPFSS